MVGSEAADMGQRVLFGPSPGRDIVEVGDVGDEAVITIAIHHGPVPDSIHVPSATLAANLTNGSLQKQRPDRWKNVRSD